MKVRNVDFGFMVVKTSKFALILKIATHMVDTQKTIYRIKMMKLGNFHAMTKMTHILHIKDLFLQSGMLAMR